MTNPEPGAAEGLLAVDKPQGPTSHDVVAAARRTLGVRRIGHTGTLDPFASGLLLLLVGRATRLAEFLHDLPKTYLARLRLGLATDTDDRTGQVTDRSEAWTHLEDVDIRTALLAQTGTRLQRPPAFSAKKVDGRRAYDAARQGQPLELEPTPVRIDRVEVRAIDLPYVEFEVTCGAGTYIRAIARDAGAELKVFGHLDALRRTRIGPFAVEEALALADMDEAAARAALRPSLEALAHLPRLDIGADQVRQVARGMRIPAAEHAAAGVVALSGEGRLVAVAEVRDGWIAPRKVLIDA